MERIMNLMELLGAFSLLFFLTRSMLVQDMHIVLFFIFF